MGQLQALGDTGRPYEPIDRFVESFRLALLQRNALFTTVHRYKGDEH
jgi:hypothetical protein